MLFFWRPSDNAYQNSIQVITICNLDGHPEISNKNKTMPTIKHDWYCLFILKKHFERLAE